MMKTIGTIDIFSQAGAARLQGGKIAPANKEPVDTRIRTLENEKSAIDKEMGKNIKDLGQMKTQLLSGVQQRDNLQAKWKGLGIISIVAGLGASALGGGIPTLIMVGVSVAAAIGGGISYLKTQNLNSNLHTLSDAMTYKSGYNSANEMESKLLESELQSARAEKKEVTKQEIDKMSEGLKEEPAEGKKRGFIEDLGNLIKIGGITLKKKKSSE